MQSPADGPENVHAAWRMAVAQRVAEAYAGNPNVAALAVAGSVGAGLADRFSDLELDCYWGGRPPTPTGCGPVAAVGGELLALWDYDEDDEEWSEDYRVGELDITVSNFLVELRRAVPRRRGPCGRAPTRSGTCAWPPSSARAR